MKNKSVWSDIKNEISCPTLKQNLEVDVLIIGGGLTGISTAYHLINSNLNVCLVEKNKIGSGVSSRTTGKLTFLQENIYSKLYKFHGLEKTKLYLDSQIEAINLAKKIIETNNIDCNLEKVKSYVFNKYEENKLKKEIKILKKLNVPIKITDKLPNGEKVNKAFSIENTFVFHPLKYIYKLEELCLNNNISIYENTKILKIEKNENGFICKTEKNLIKAKYVVLALHYPYFLMPFWMPLKSHIEKSYIKAFTIDKNNKFSSISTSSPTVSTRYHTDKNINYQLYLTNSHNTCIKENDLENFKPLLKNRPDFIWSNKDIITNDLLPFIGALNNDQTLLIGTGYNTWGMTNGTLAGKILADIILNKPNKYLELFKPTRKINLGKVLNFPLILISNVWSFTKSKLIVQKKWYPKNVIFKKENGQNIAIYIDENKKEHVVYNKCPHLKCGLIFNEIEKTWDCPCHGSRFDIDGNSIEGPSNYSIKYK
ncbi:MAG: FAD-dependent oxidoreductase [Bacilli bacterium]|nr:FAD-dependent oxidoreductase [Bacilli bacterium]